jgi:hypothetical protein
MRFQGGLTAHTSPLTLPRVSFRGSALVYRSSVYGWWSLLSWRRRFVISWRDYATSVTTTISRFVLWPLGQEDVASIAMQRQVRWP